MSGVSFLVLLQGIRRVSSVTLDKISPYPDKTETLKLSLQTSLSEGFYNMVLLLDKIVLEIELDLFSVSIL